MTVICPNCGFKHAAEPYAEELYDLRLPNLERSALARLISARGGIVSNNQLVDHLWGDSIDGGPDGARHTVMSYMSKIRRKIEPLGWSISGRKFEGYRLTRTQP